MSNWIARIYKYDEECTGHVVIRDRTEHEAEHEVTNDVQDVHDWSLVMLTDREDVWSRAVDAIVEALQKNYHGSINAYTQLDHGWDSLDIIECIIEIEDLLKVQIQDDILEGIAFSDRTPCEVAQDFVDRMTDEQITKFLRHVEQGDKLDKADLEIELEKTLT